MPTDAGASVQKQIALARNILLAEDGAVAIQMALTMVVLIGMGALATDIGYALFVQRQLQSAADAAAFSAAIAKSTNHPTITTEAYAVAGKIGFVTGANGVTVTVNNPPVNPPASAADAGNASAVQVIIQQSLTLPLISAVCPLLPGGGCSGAFTVAAQAVAAPGAGGACAWQLSGSATPGVTISNGAVVNLEDCGLTVCSTATSGNKALSISGGAALNIKDSSGNFSNKYPVSVAGGASITNGATINNVSNACQSPTCKQNQGACVNADPYAGVTMPTMPGGCSLGTAKSYGYSATLQTISPGVWCNGVSFGSSAQIKLNPGVYYVKGGYFNVGGAVTMTGTGVTIVLTGSASDGYSTPYAEINNPGIGNGANVTLTAPTTGATAGIVFFGDRNAPASNVNIFGGGASMDITGAIYLPTQQAQFSNGIANPSGCTQLIAGQIQFTGGANFSNNCAGMGTSGSGGATALLE